MARLIGLFRYRIAPAIVFCLICLGLAGVAMVVVRFETERLLARDARMEAQNWARYLVNNIVDFDAMLAGAAPSLNTMTFLQHSRQMGRLVRFRVYDTHGRLRIDSSELGQANSYRKRVSGRNRALFEAAMAGRPAVKSVADENGGDGVAVALTPLAADGKIVGVLEVNVTQAGRRAMFSEIAAHTGILFGLLLGLAPLVGFIYRSRQKEQIERNLQFLTRHDPLTHLPNRAAFTSALTCAVNDRHDEEGMVALHLLDIDRFRLVNEEHGHATGDMVLRRLAEKLRKLVGSHGFVGRVGGNRFAIFHADVADVADADAFAARLTSAVAEPLTRADAPISLSVTVGVSLAPDDAESADELLSHAETALMAARENGRERYRFYDMSVEQGFARRRTIERIIAGALANDGFELHFQPLVCLNKRRLSSFEALVRLHDPVVGMIGPDEFIPVAEETGAINEIGRWCLHQALTTAGQWPADIKVAVNLSPVQFEDGTLPQTVAEAVKETGVPAHRLELEVTEGLLLDDGPAIQSQLAELRKQGVHIVLDDFGAGYSSLGYLWKFGFNKIKVDKALVSAIASSKRARGILRALVSMCHELGFPVTCEGVENEDEARYLMEIGCDQVQGYLFGKPLPAGDLAGFILRDFKSKLIEIDAAKITAQAPDREVVSA